MSTLTSRVTKATYSSLCEKIDRKLSVWKTKYLSLAGKITLTKSTVTTMAKYTMQPANISVQSAMTLIRRKGELYGKVMRTSTKCTSFHGMHIKAQMRLVGQGFVQSISNVTFFTKVGCFYVFLFLFFSFSFFLHRQINYLKSSLSFFNAMQYHERSKPHFLDTTEVTIVTTRSKTYYVCYSPRYSNWS